MMKFLKKHWEVLSYLIFGVLTTLLNIVLYALFSRLFAPPCRPEFLISRQRFNV